MLKEARIRRGGPAEQEASQPPETRDDRNDPDRQQERRDADGPQGLDERRDMEAGHGNHRRARRRPASTATSLRPVERAAPNGLPHVR